MTQQARRRAAEPCSQASAGARLAHAQRLACACARQRRRGRGQPQPAISPACLATRYWAAQVCIAATTRWSHGRRVLQKPWDAPGDTIRAVVVAECAPSSNAAPQTREPMAALLRATACAGQPHRQGRQSTGKLNGAPPKHTPEAQRCKRKMEWLAALAAACVVALQSPPLLARTIDFSSADATQAGEVIEEPHSCRPSCIWGDAVCRALLGERWSGTREHCSTDDAPDIPELQGDAPPPYVSHAPQRKQQ